ncbi:hypothetical protein M569_04285, partial [Genlisea aurea]
MSSTQIISDNLEEVMASRSAAGAAEDLALLSSADGRAVSLADSSPMEVTVHLGPATEQEAQQTISCLSSFSDNLEEVMGSSSAAGAAEDHALLSSADGRAVSLADSSPMEVLVHLGPPGAAEDHALLSFADGRAVSLADSSPMIHLGPATDQQAQETISCLSSFSKIGNSIASLPAAVVGALKSLSENPRVQKVVSSLLRDANIWIAFMQNPEVKKMTSASVVMATEISSTT